MKWIFRVTAPGASLLLAATVFFAAEPAPPKILSLTVSNTQKRLRWTPYPAADAYLIQSTPGVHAPFTNDLSGSVSGFGWTGTNTQASQFFRLVTLPLDSNALLTANVLNRLAYGPTPDELERVLTRPGAIGPDAYIAEQLAPETIPETMEALTEVTTNGADWVYVTATGTSVSSHPELWIYLSGAGEAWIDELKLVAGHVAEAGINLLANSGFEAPLNGTWELAPNFATSSISSAVRRSGNGALHLVATAAGTGYRNSAWQALAMPLPAGELFTLSFWYVPSTNQQVTVRLPNANLLVTPGLTAAGLHRTLRQGRGTVADLRSWYCQHAVSARRQLLEVLTQFWENHFVTRSFKSFEYHDIWMNDNLHCWRTATAWEWREIHRWRTTLMTPAGTFHDLLVASAESPAMIIYLDTARSKGNPPNIPNENYARELLELFTFGLDNGYDQSDIVEMSKVWSGWTVRVVAANDAANPLAPATMALPIKGTNYTEADLAGGVWAFNFDPDSHYPGAVTLFPGRTVPARFGAPWAGRPYELALPGRPGTNGLQDGHEVLRHLANQPFTQEFICVKLCRWFVHDDFAHGYDFTDPNLSEEGRLVKQCMLAWENASPKGQVRPVLRTIFDSDLFRRHGGSLQKAKTPLEFLASAVRALRSANADGTATAETDAYSFAGILARMGGMNLFDRLEPDGYPESAQEWLSAGTLAERLRFVQSYCITVNQPGHVGAINDASGSTCDPVALLRKKLPPAKWGEAGAVTDYFLGIFFPGEGRANLDLLRHAAISFLNRADDGATPAPFSSVATTGYPSPYENRVRGMVALLLSSPRFQEQ